MREVRVRDVWDIPGRWCANLRYVVTCVGQESVIAELHVKEEGELAEHSGKFCTLPLFRFNGVVSCNTCRDTLEYSHVYTGELAAIPESLLAAIGVRVRLPQIGLMPADRAKKKIDSMHERGFAVVEDENGKCYWRKIREGCPL